MRTLSPITTHYHLTPPTPPRPQIVLIAFITTAGIVAGITLLAFTIPFDLTKRGHILAAAAMIFFMMMLITIIVGFFYGGWLNHACGTVTGMCAHLHGLPHAAPVPAAA